MGGLGSGRHWHWGAKATTHEMRELDVRRLAREGILNPGTRISWQWSCDGEKVADIQIAVENNRMRLVYKSRSHGDDWELLDYPVRLLRTPCHYGGFRNWFECPAQGCGRRVAILYGGRIFACRHCYQLAYTSQREESYQRHHRRAESIRNRLGWDQDWGLKPKGMHSRTFDRLVAELDFWERKSDSGFTQYFLSRFGNLDLS
ncbi:hypothetical protein [Shimia haliotis]|uniref:Uncharacterized protein n=1 Tax=Shimia haliotis TaxID=1280847 RepID=A0A1I4HCX7_9RHOB|nr:hypothetical protein [Shimia haliotis]SFL39553.1 hypothetical protein SAMN04488036_11224 [Shimia haliotis]